MDPEGTVAHPLRVWGSPTHLEEFVAHSDSSPGRRAFLRHPRDEYALEDEQELSPQVSAQPGRASKAQQPPGPASAEELRACGAQAGLEWLWPHVPRSWRVISLQRRLRPKPAQRYPACTQGCLLRRPEIKLSLESERSLVSAVSAWGVQTQWLRKSKSPESGDQGAEDNTREKASREVRRCPRLPRVPGKAERKMAEVLGQTKQGQWDKKSGRWAQLLTSSSPL